MLEAVREEIPFAFEEVPIDDDPALEATHRERIPVVTIDGEVAFSLFVHPDSLRRRLSGR